MLLFPRLPADAFAGLPADAFAGLPTVALAGLPTVALAGLACGIIVVARGRRIAPPPGHG
ncbi:hypothetical protein JQ776_20095 [Klebsiella quasipneumoniae subsp. similipneumoniae]|uniref:hypothetical protein n=1 Tax=Klebsiella quasipneumoniae TaxID=1463165 RepID=UPI001FB5E636|nr:hypothetical protein [Klebsiella quasipneumoniae]MCJ1855763.1 hypothetical protein [Klebsiella quasipneumoniae subsp. similipneumoniae]